MFHRAWVCSERPGLGIANIAIASAAVEAGDKSWLFNKGVHAHQVSVDSGLVPMVTHKSRGWTRFDPCDGPVFHDGIPTK